MDNLPTSQPLAAQLQALGFPPALERALRVHALFAPLRITLCHHEERGEDRIEATLFFQQEGAGGYRFTHYELCLHKAPLLPAGDGDNPVVAQLQNRMGAVDWKTLGRGEYGEEVFKEIEDIVSALQALSLASESKGVAEALKAKYWRGTPLEVYCTEGSALRSQQGITQRFYFFEGEAPITLDEAYRFLCHRLRERSRSAQGKDGGGPASTRTGNQENGKEGPGHPKKRSGKGGRTKR